MTDDCVYFVNKKRYGDSRMRKTMHEIHRSVDRIDDISRIVAQLNLLASARLLLADELVIGIFCENAIHQQLFDLLVGFGYKVGWMGFNFISFPLRVA